MKKRLIVSVLGMLLIFSLSGCGSSSTEMTPSPSTTTDVSTSVVNPMVEYPDLAGLTGALGYEPLHLSENADFQPNTYFMIDNTVAEINYLQRGNAGLAVSIRSAYGKDDISGIYGITYSDRELNGLTVHEGSGSGTNVAWFVKGDKVFSVTATGLSQVVFDNLLADITATASTMP